MNSEQFKRTGGLDASRTTMQFVFSHSDLPLDLQEAIIEACKNVYNPPGMETMAQAVIDSYTYFGEWWGVKMLFKNSMTREHNSFRKWKGIKAAKMQKLIKNWINRY